MEDKRPQYEAPTIREVTASEESPDARGVMRELWERREKSRKEIAEVVSEHSTSVTD